MAPSSSYSVPQFCRTCGTSNHTTSKKCAVCGEVFNAPNTQPVSTVLQSSLPSLSETGFLPAHFLLKGRYLILETLGQGGFGAVYKVADTFLGNRFLAIKEMSQAGLDPQELTEATNAFQHEALLLATLIHPHLPRIHDSFSENSRSYIVMDFIEGKTLETILAEAAQGRLSVEDVLSIGVQLCSVLIYLHGQTPPVIFRDLKPANILCQEETIYLIDFGIARHFDHAKTHDTTALGSNGYAAPEQYGKSQTTPRSDLYSLGATLYQILSGDNPSLHPFRFPSLAVNKGPLAAGHPVLADLDALVQSMVSVPEDRRPNSALIVKQELERIATQMKQRGPTLLSSSSSKGSIPQTTILTPGAPYTVSFLFSSDGQTGVNEFWKQLAMIRQNSAHLVHFDKEGAMAQQANMLLVIMTPNLFIEYYEMLEVLVHDQNKQIIPIVYKPCPWHESVFASKQALPRNLNAISEARSKDSVYYEVAGEITALIKQIAGLPR